MVGWGGTRRDDRWRVDQSGAFSRNAILARRRLRKPNVCQATARQAATRDTGAVSRRGTYRARDRSIIRPLRALKKPPFLDHTFSNGTSILLRCSSHSGTGRFLERMKSGLNSFDWYRFPESHSTVTM